MARAAVVFLVLVAACGETRREVYMRGMKVEREAEQGPCKLMYDKELGANVLSGDQVQHCLKGQEEALAIYDQAAAMGLKDVDFVAAHERARERVKKLEMMLQQVREMEAPEYPGLGKP